MSSTEQVAGHASGPGRAHAVHEVAGAAGSTGFQVSPPTLRADPTMTPSATARTSATVSCLTPVLASTGVGQDALDGLQVAHGGGLRR